MPRRTVVLAVLLCCVVVPAFALYTVSDRGEWPKSWPRQLEHLRSQSRTLEGPVELNRHYAIRFTNRKDFEAAWPNILKVKTKGAPVFLRRAPNFFLGGDCKAGVVLHCPPHPQPGSHAEPENPIAGVTNPAERWMNATYIELIVDDNIVNLQRITLPKGTQVVDELNPSKEKQQ